MLKEKKILIIGGAGFIGINAARYFLDRGWVVTIFDNFSRKGTDINVRHLEVDYPGQAKVIEGDIVKKPEELLPLMETHAVVLHLAAQVAVTTSIADPRNDFEQNALGTFNVLEAVRKSDAKPMLLFSSTNKVYGGLEHLSVHEEDSRYVFDNDEVQMWGVSEHMQLDFHSPYGCSKGVADQYVIDYARIYGLRTVVFRQSCIYGKHQFGVEDQGWLAWFAIAAMLNRPLTLFGTGKQVRDALYVEDLCRLYELAIGNIDTVSGQAFNAGGGPLNTLSLIELLNILKNKYGFTVDPTRANPRAGDQPIFVADIRKAKEILHWEPKVSVTEGIDAMHGWLIENKAEIEKFF